MSRASRYVRKYLYAGVSTAYLFTAGVTKARNRRLLGEIARHFGYREGQPVPEEIPDFQLTELVPANVAFRIAEPIAADGNVSLYELVAINSIVQFLQPTASFEIGTFNGRTTLNIAVNSSVEARVFTLDLPAADLDTAKLPLDPEDVKYIRKMCSGERFQDSGLESRITQLYGDSATFDFTPFKGQIDFVFVDGSHAYDYVLSDSSRALELLRDGKGIVIWHDYGGWDGVTSALNELYRTDPRYRRLRRIRGTSLVYLLSDDSGPR